MNYHFDIRPMSYLKMRKFKVSSLPALLVVALPQSLLGMWLIIEYHNQQTEQQVDHLNYVASHQQQLLTQPDGITLSMMFNI